MRFDRRQEEETLFQRKRKSSMCQLIEAGTTIRTHSVAELGEFADAGGAHEHEMRQIGERHLHHMRALLVPRASDGGGRERGRGERQTGPSSRTRKTVGRRGERRTLR